MADFQPGFEKMIRNEGGYILHEVSGDRGGLTYAGIAENFHPNWEGWALLKKNPDDPAITQLVRDFYKQQFWDRINCDLIESQIIAESIFDFAVNAGIKTASKLAQIVVDATPDGIIGNRTVGKLNEVDEEHFRSNFALAKIARYASIVTKNPGQGKFLLGWINRTLGGLK